MKTIRYAFWAIVALCLILIGLVILISAGMIWGAGKKKS